MGGIIILKSEVNKKIKEIDKYLKETLNTVLEESSIIESRELSIHQFHAKIGHEIVKLTNATHKSFLSSEHFVTAWLEGLSNDTYAKIRLLPYLKNQITRDYIIKYLERSFYKRYDEYTKFKPSKGQDIIWFGNKKNPYAIYISHRDYCPCKDIDHNDDGHPVSDISEIRKVKFQYWSIGHIMSTGIYDTQSKSFKNFKSYRELIDFYNILYNESNSNYEKSIFKNYIEYLKNKYYSQLDDTTINFIANREPILIPEFRLKGREVEHKYRLDFSIFNCNTQEFIGFEISPTSTHMAVSDTNLKTNYQINNEIKNNWGKEVDKRNEYFYNFTMNIITFADNELKDIDKCFDIIMSYITKKEVVSHNPSSIINHLITE